MTRVLPGVYCDSRHAARATVRTIGSVEGIRCTTAERALLDGWRVPAAPEPENLLWEALWARACTWRQLRRELDLAAAGYVVVRFGWRDVTGRPEWCRQRLWEVMRSRAPHRGST
ncbi:hypothetical protein [Demequina capsici]|uniref:Uncharacterized protein n=1 Tax=Demequina capsici TaxID=3075620 RepID=A0AA96J816_9MICO|nr:hypothetical protein [Demequina sp. OYTSA14]WNM24583.1 hypothetical protein RN606_00080 [Demequina sp. OYTSA14]